MNKTAFKPGEGAKPTTELEYKALLAVMQADGCPVWPEPGSLPPVGEVCECTFGACNYWSQCVLTTQGELIVFPDGAKPIRSALAGFPRLQFRPIKTEREKLIDQGEKDIKSKSPELDRTVIAALIDAGWRPTK